MSPSISIAKPTKSRTWIPNKWPNSVRKLGISRSGARAFLILFSTGIIVDSMKLSWILLRRTTMKNHFLSSRRLYPWYYRGGMLLELQRRGQARLSRICSLWLNMYRRRGRWKMEKGRSVSSWLPQENWLTRSTYRPRNSAKTPEYESSQSTEAYKYRNSCQISEKAPKL